MIPETIILPDKNSLPKEDRGDWVCWYDQGKTHAKEFHNLLKKSGIISFGANNYTNIRKIYYVTKYGGVFSMDKKEFNKIRGGSIGLGMFLADTIIQGCGGKSFEEHIKNAYELKF